MSLRNYHYLLCNNTEERSSQLQWVNLAVIFIMVGTDDNQLDKENFMQNRAQQISHNRNKVIKYVMVNNFNNIYHNRSIKTLVPQIHRL